MKKLKLFWESNSQTIIVLAAVFVALAGLLLYKLGSLNKGGLSYAEWQSRVATYGWHGLFNSPFYLPIKLLRSIVYSLGSGNSQFITRLPNVIIGTLTIIIFAWLIRFWHGSRTAILSTLVFACSAWVLHVSRLASNDVIYLILVPILLLSVAAMQRHANKPLVFYGSLLLWGSLLYIPGAIWLVALTAFWERKAVKLGWLHFKSIKQRALYIFCGLIWLPLLVTELTRQGALKTWLGLSTNYTSPLSMLSNLWKVIYNLLFHGPKDSSIWLVNAPIFDIFTLLMIAFGIYFYAKHWRVGRARILLSYFIASLVLISVGGVVTLSVIVPIFYICAATGIAYLIHEWLQVFQSILLQEHLASAWWYSLFHLAASTICVHIL